MNTILGHKQKLSKTDRNARVKELAVSVLTTLKGRSAAQLTKKELYWLNKQKEEIIQLSYPVVLAVYRKYHTTCDFSDVSKIILEALEKYVKRGNPKFKLSAFVYYQALQTIEVYHRKRVNEADLTIRCQSLVDSGLVSGNSVILLDMDAVQTHLQQVDALTHKHISPKRKPLSGEPITSALANKYLRVVTSLKTRGVVVPELISQMDRVSSAKRDTSIDNLL
jgi:hypothetical protein